MPAPRGPTSRATLTIEWEHPAVSRAARGQEGRTTAVQARVALPAEEALALVRGDDPRPLLVLRECKTCSGTEDALLSSLESNERTYLLSRWFHCIKLSPDVLEADHPFRNLFPGDLPCHLFLCNADGSARHDLNGAQSRRELWSAMDALVQENYVERSAGALREMARILDDMDEVDGKLADLETRYELALATGDGPEAIKKLQRKIAEARGKRDELIAAVQKAAKLELRPRDPAHAGPAAGPG